MSLAMTLATPWIMQLLNAPLSERSFFLTSLVDAEFRVWLHMSATDTLPHDESYFSLGLSSLGAVEIQERLETGFGCKIDSATLYNNPTIHHLVSTLRTDALASLFTDANATTAPNADADASTMTDDKLASQKILNDMLATLYDS